MLSRISATRPKAAAGERCEMCTRPIGDEHQHVVDVSSRALMCTCRPCYLLFTDEQAHLRYRAVPDRYLSFPGFALFAGQWDDLEIPVGLAFFFHNSQLGRTVAFYPGPAGATESELPIGAWDRLVADNPTLARCSPTSRPCIVRAPERERSRVRLPPGADRRCYELVGGLRLAWRGFDGGQEARALLDAFFAELRGARPGGRLMPELTFTVLDVAPEPYAAAPNLLARLRVEETTGEVVHALALRAQVRIEPQRRRYDDAEEQALLDLFGGREPVRRDAEAVLCGCTRRPSPRASPARPRSIAGAALHATTSRSPARRTCTPCGTARSRWCCCSAARCSPAGPPASRSSRCRGTARRPTGCRSRCGGR